ncbi:MAG TPA: hypothetical protein DCM86_18650 [Verrucomicrobiales bacterium]|nr:hypothetical protein [Verrucomicrobiales bacterium]
MRTGRILALLVLLNVAAILYFARTRPAAGRATGESAPLVVTQWMSVATAPPSLIPHAGGTNVFRWGQLETEDYKEFIARLRAVECPEQTIRDLIIADIDKLYASRIQALRPMRKTLHYWESEESELANNQDQREVQRREREIEREKARIVKDLLGVDLAAERQRIHGAADKLERRLAFLPEERRADLRHMVESLEERELALKEKAWDSGSSLSAGDREALRQVREQREAALRSLLTPAEREQYDLWMSPTAEALRHDFYGMEASEEEFQAVYALRRTFDEAWPADSIDTQDPKATEAWGAALLQLEDRVKEALGEERFSMYQRGQDGRFHDLNVTASRFSLPREKAAEAYEYLRISAAEKSRVLENGALTPEQQSEVAGKIDAETQRALQELLGPGAYHYFSRLSR